MRHTNRRSLAVFYRPGRGPVLRDAPGDDGTGTGSGEGGTGNTDKDGDGEPGESETDTTDWKAEAARLKADSDKNKADAEKWKALSRKNEKDKKDAAKAGLSDAEKAIEDARASSAKETAQTYGRRLALAEFKAAAAGKVDLGDLIDDLDMSKFVDEDGEVDVDAIKARVDKYAARNGKPKAKAGKSGGEFNGGSGAGVPITEDQLAKMTPAEVAKAYSEGKLKHLM
jgi:hypothetical protein